MIKPIKIGNLHLDNNLFLAPMSGVSNVAFRLLCRKYGASLCFTEFVNSHSILNQNLNEIDRLKTDLTDKPLGIQIFGNDINSLMLAASKVESNADIVDLNLGCPAYRIIRSGCGSELLKNISKVKDIVGGIVNSVSCPVSVKIRSGIDFNNINAVEIAKACEEVGVKMITVHGRTQKQGYSGKSDLLIIKAVKNAVNIPVIANGDITDYNNALKTFEFTGCDGIMIGRAAMTNPSIFREIITGNKNSVDKLELLNEYYILLKKYDLGFVSLKENALNFMRGIYGASELRSKISSFKSFEDFDLFLSKS